MGERNSRRRKKILFSDTSPPTRNSNAVHTHWGTLLLSKKKFVVLRRRYMAFPKTGEGFFPFWKMRERHASFSPSSLLPSVMPVKKRRKKKEGKGGRLYIFYGMAERAMVSRRKGGSGGGFIYFFRYIRLGFFRSGKPGHGLGSFFFANGRRRTVRCIRWLQGEKWRSERKSGETGVFYY